MKQWAGYVWEAFALYLEKYQEIYSTIAEVIDEHFITMHQSECKCLIRLRYDHYLCVYFSCK